MNTCRFHKAFSILVFALTGIFVMSSSIAATIKITNKISPIQIGATIYDNGGNKGSPSINIWPPKSGGAGITVRPNNTWTYNPTVANGSDTTFGVQVNSARRPRSGGKCDQLCGHVKVTISADGKTCSVSRGTGTCGSNPKAPKWKVPSQSGIPISGGVCNVTLTTVRIFSPVVCACENGKYPCTSTVLCGPSTSTPVCPKKQPPLYWKK